MKTYKKLIICLAFAGTALSCDRMEDNYGAALLESIETKLSAANPSSEQEPTSATILERAEAGHVLTVVLGEGSAIYEYSSGAFVPSGEPLQFNGYGAQELSLRLAPEGEPEQDGTLEGLLDADALVYTNASLTPVPELAGVEMTHENALVEIRLDSGLGIDEGTAVSVGGNTAYNIPSSDSWQAIIEPGIPEFNITFFHDGIRYTVPVSASRTDDGQFLANRKYILSLASTGSEVVLQTVAISGWTDSGVSAGSRLVETVFDFGTEYTASTAQVTLKSGAVKEMGLSEENGHLTGKITSQLQDAVLTVQFGDNAPLNIGRGAGETITMYLNANGTGVERRTDSQGNYIIGTVMELRMIDGDGNRTANYLQEEDLYLTGINWTPMCDHSLTPSQAFEGTYDGNGKNIYDLTVENGLGGLFRGNEGTIKNVTIASGLIGGSIYINTAAICGYNLGTIENCINHAPVSCDSWGAGIAALNEGTIRNCENHGSVNSVPVGSYVMSYNAGITAINGQDTPKAIVENCRNYGKITGTSYYSAGIAAANRQGTVSECENNGVIENGTYFIGGIVGENTALIQYCVNDGIVNAGGQGGGIVGTIFGGTIVGCTNNADITMNEIGGGGGIAGSINIASAAVEITGCVNYGDVESGSATGGIVSSNYKAVIRACANHGDITSRGDNAGGIAAENGGLFGDNSPAIQGCLNTGDIKAVNFAGGIAGNNMLIIGSSYSTGNISVTNTGGNIGGIAGRNDQYNGTGAKILNCYYANAEAAYGTDSNPASSEITAWAFSATAWPTDDPSSGWGVGNDYENGYFWNTLGHWDAVSPEYPQLSLPASPSASASMAASSGASTPTVTDMAASSPVSDNAFEGLDKAIREGISASPSPASAEHR